MFETIGIIATMIFRLDPPWIALLLPIPLIALSLWWSYYIAFPVLMEKMLRTGKTWLYFPKKWGDRRLLIIRVDRIIFLFTGAFLGFSIWWSFASHWITLLVLLLLGIAVIFPLTRRVMVMRYEQQSKLYYDRLNERFSHLQEKQTLSSEVEVRNMISWEHQQLLLKADRQEKLLELLSGEIAECDLQDISDE